jgi:alpha-N-arabinofuranosidase
MAGKERGRLVVRLRTSADQGSSGVIVAEQPLGADGPIDLRLALDGGSARVFWRAGDESESGLEWQPVGERINVEPLASVYAGLFTGLVVGPYAHSPG